MFIEMKVSGLTMDPITNTPIVILKDLEEKKAIPDLDRHFRGERHRDRDREDHLFTSHDP